jgi:type II secretory pathway component GspD/PulD (secretin)
MKLRKFVVIAALLVFPVVSVAQTTTYYECAGTHQGETVVQTEPCVTKTQTRGKLTTDEGKTRSYTGQAVTLNFKRTTLASVIKILANVGDVNIRVDPKANLVLSISVVNEPWDQVLAELVSRYNLDFRIVDGVGYIR